MWPIHFSSRPVRTANVAVILHFDPPILMFSVQREDKGSVCTCAGEHLNKCIVFVQKSATSCPFFTHLIKMYPAFWIYIKAPENVDSNPKHLPVILNIYLLNVPIQSQKLQVGAVWSDLTDSGLATLANNLKNGIRFSFKCC